MFEPEFPCRVMPTRHCPSSYRAICGERPCARFESEDDAPWLASVTYTFPHGLPIKTYESRA